MHSMSGAGAGDHGGGSGQLYGDDQPDVGSMFFGAGGGDAAAGFTPSYSSITDYLQGFLDPAGLARHLDAPPCVPTGDAAVKREAAAVPAVATPNSSASSEPPRGRKGGPAPEEWEVDEEGSAPDHQSSRSDEKKQKQKKGKVEKKARGSRVAFATKSEVDHLDDGYRWRKYGQKAVKNSSFPRSYYRCTAARCGVKKQVERSQQDPATVVTTYEGHHAHPSPAAHRGGMATGLYSLGAAFQPQRPGFFGPSSPDDLLLTAARAMAPPAAAASPAALLPRQAEHRFAEYYGLQDLLPDPLMGNQHVHR